MSYLEYVVGAYAVFAIVLLWDWLVPQLQVRAALRAAARRSHRQRTAGTVAPSSELPLSRD